MEPNGEYSTTAAVYDLPYEAESNYFWIIVQIKLVAGW